MGKRSAQPKQKEESAKSTIAKLLELPESTLLTGGVVMELHSNREAIVEGCSGVLEYGEGIIRLSAGSMVIKFCGRNLSIGGLDRSSTVVSGQITSIEFVS